MSDDDDYFSDKFLAASTSHETSKPLTYSQRRKEAKRTAEIKNAQNRTKGRRQREAEAREEGLSKTLFERAQEEEEQLGTKNKALNMMMKMGFKPGQALGQSEEEAITAAAADGPPAAQQPQEETPPKSREDTPVSSGIGHRKVPINVDIWAGKKGVGLGKRAPSPIETERIAKAAKLAENASRQNFVGTAREAYEERRAEGRLRSARRTVLTLDEKAGITTFNVLTLDPHDVESFPPSLVDDISVAMSDPGAARSLTSEGGLEAQEERIRRQMRRDALTSLETLDDEDSTFTGLRMKDAVSQKPSVDKPNQQDEDHFSEGTLEEAKTFLQLPARERLERVLDYLRQKHYYCFWCGTQYDSSEDMQQNCPGATEEDHD